MARTSLAPRGQHPRRSRTRLAAASVALAITLAGCNMSIEEYCATAVPEFERKLAQASAELPQRKIVIRSRGRRPSSAVPVQAAVSEGGAARFSDEDKERWREWSQNR